MEKGHCENCFANGGTCSALEVFDDERRMSEIELHKGSPGEVEPAAVQTNLFAPAHEAAHATVDQRVQIMKVF